MATENEQYYIDNAPGHVVPPTIESNIGKLWKQFSRELDQVDFARFQLTQLNLIQRQSGINLDNIGAKIGLTRKGLTDETYKLVLEIASVDEAVDSDYVITLIAKLFRADSIDLYPDYPAGVIVGVNGINPIITPSEIGTILQLLWKFARKYSVVVTEGINAFAFLGSDGKGFDDLSAPGDGGIFSEIIYSP